MQENPPQYQPGWSSVKGKPHGLAYLLLKSNQIKHSPTFLSCEGPEFVL